MNRLVAAACLLAACAHATPTVRGADLHDRVAELRARGRVAIDGIEVRRGEYLVDRDRGQLFAVDEVIAGCTGAPDAECTLALLRDQRFAVYDHPPTPAEKHDSDGGWHVSPRNTALLVTGLTTPAIAASSYACDHNCHDLILAAAAGDGLTFLLLLLLKG